MDKAKVRAMIGRMVTITVVVPTGYATVRAEIVRVTDSGVYILFRETVGVEYPWGEIVSIR